MRATVRSGTYWDSAPSAMPATGIVTQLEPRRYTHDETHLDPLVRDSTEVCGTRGARRGNSGGRGYISHDGRVRARR
jgi:hypothetical protein